MNLKVNKVIDPIMETDRILLRPLKIEDAETVFRNWSSDPDVVKYMEWSLHQSINDTVEWLTKENALSETNYTWGFVLKENKKLFGSGGFYYNKEHKMHDFGYCIMKKYWNFGLTTEAVIAIIDYAKQKFGNICLHAKHAKGNQASGRVLEKVGFVYQKDSMYSSFDGKRIFESREYILSL
jgi:ribosomal-protein-alanine N-acetyltransferase